MTTETTTAHPAATDARPNADMAELRALSGSFHVGTRLVMLSAALATRRWTKPVRETLAAINAAIGSRSARACYCFDRDWTLYRWPEVIALSELWTRAGVQGLLSASCRPCSAKPDSPQRIITAIQRDLNVDPTTAPIIEREGRA